MSNTLEFIKEHQKSIGALTLLIIIIIVIAFTEIPKYYTSAEIWSGKAIIPWGILVPSYVYFALASTGSSIINSLYTVFGYKGRDKGFEKVIKHGVWFSLITIIPAWTMIIMDLGRPDHFMHMITGFNVYSRIAWMGALYAFFALMLLIELIYFIRADVNAKLREWKALELTIAILVLFATIAVHSNLGEVFGSSTGVPGWYGPHVGAYFIASAVLIGAAWQALYYTAIYGSKGQLTQELKNFINTTYNKIYLIGIPSLYFFVIWMFMTAYYYPPAWEQIKQLLHGEFSKEFYIAEVLFMLIIAYLLSIAGYKLANILPTAALATTLTTSIILIVGGYISKIDFILSGEIARLKYTSESMLGPMNPYYIRFGWYHLHISAPEASVVIFAVSIWLFLLLLGELVLPLERGEKPKHLWIFR